MQFYSTNHQSKKVGFREAVLKGLADDKGLYFPEGIPLLPEKFFKDLNQLSLPEIGYHFLKPYVGDELTAIELKYLLEDALNFDIPLFEIDSGLSVLELFHGPTLAFKDVGARTMARFLSRFAANQKTTILVATSGDTGSAVAHGFYGVDNVEVVILYPKGKVSLLQEKQFTTLGGNITALEVDGNFDDCQRMVKEAFADKELKEKLTLSSANSINIARLLPQAIYYFYAYGQLKDKSKPLVFSVPSGNYGNLTAGLIAKRSGLPVARFIASSNRNDVVPEYFQTGYFRPRPSISTISNAMDVGNPSNFARMLELYNNDLRKMMSEISAYSFSDEQTRNVISEFYRQNQYILDPHGAVAYLGLDAFKSDHIEMYGIFLETAHPAKFKFIVEEQITVPVTMPESLSESLQKKMHKLQISATFYHLKGFLLR
ncbi:MAG: threonine synthase [Bacteroidales bacterium]|nr:threonine synthase [Bacteroidales bacterium]